MDRLEYELRYPAFGSHYYKWTVYIGKYTLTGEANSVRQVYRRARKAVKRHQKFQRLLEEK